jgi:5-methylcytosine-specific restriction endonuclease McrA
MSTSYSEKLKDPRWQKKRLEVMNRDQFTCRDCKCTTKPLHVHHCFYQKGEPWDTPSSLLLTLCFECHETRQDHEDATKELLGILFAQGDQEQCINLFKALNMIRNARADGLRVRVEMEAPCPTE